jgi:hypothetical protein
MLLILYFEPAFADEQAVLKAAIKSAIAIVIMVLCIVSTSLTGNW